ncbi:collagen alpha-1(I) chain-like [Prionailurus bengalensis]|uniref:collagen alpha-1(I) chain-like n=1 Tax=Prionailurus bengalensis TaxID=37029 RepID=UPI001CA92C0B|nr:collagen alpha-1(I) chain-like [Prionailurus bengalensis]
MVTDARTGTHRRTHVVTWSPTVTGPLARPLQPRRPAGARAHPRHPHRLLPEGRHLPARRRPPGAQRPAGRGGASLAAGPPGSQRGRGARAGSGARRGGRREMESRPRAALGILGRLADGSCSRPWASAPLSRNSGLSDQEPGPAQPGQADRVPPRPGRAGSECAGAPSSVPVGAQAGRGRGAHAQCTGPRARFPGWACKAFIERPLCARQCYRHWGHT